MYCRFQPHSNTSAPQRRPRAGAAGAAGSRGPHPGRRSIAAADDEAAPGRSAPVDRPLGEEYTREAQPRTLLVHLLRDELDLNGTRWGCDTSNCGTCVVLMDGEPVKSCTVLAATAAGHEIRTVEGLEVDGVLDPIQQGFKMRRHENRCDVE